MTAERGAETARERTTHGPTQEQSNGLRSSESFVFEEEIYPRFNMGLARDWLTKLLGNVDSRQGDQELVGTGDRRLIGR
jgi:hypothetical protein